MLCFLVCLLLNVPVETISLIVRRHSVGVGMQHLDLYLAPRAFEQEGIFIVPRLHVMGP